VKPGVDERQEETSDTAAASVARSSDAIISAILRPDTTRRAATRPLKPLSTLCGMLK